MQWFRVRIGTVQYGRPGDIPIPRTTNGRLAPRMSRCLHDRQQQRRVAGERAGGQPGASRSAARRHPDAGDYAPTAGLLSRLPSVHGSVCFVRPRRRPLYDLHRGRNGASRGDIPVRADFYGDAVWTSSSSARRTARGISTGRFVADDHPFGCRRLADRPRRDGDGRYRFDVWRPSTGVVQSAHAATKRGHDFWAFGFPATSDRHPPHCRPARCRTSMANEACRSPFFRASSATWFITRFSRATGLSGTSTTSFRADVDVRRQRLLRRRPCSDLAVYRPSTTRSMFLLADVHRVWVVTTLWPIAGDFLFPADYTTANGRTDIPRLAPIFRPLVRVQFPITVGSTVTQGALSPGSAGGGRGRRGGGGEVGEGRRGG